MSIRDDLEERYRAYIACLNERRLDEAETYYCDHLLYNGERISRARWRRQAIEDSFASMPDLQWHIEQLVIEGEYLAARLIDTGTLVTPFRGVQPTGRPAQFGENVFYRLQGNRTDEVWSIVDLTALEQSQSERATG